MIDLIDKPRNDILALTMTVFWHFNGVPHLHGTFSAWSTQLCLLDAYGLHCVPNRGSPSNDLSPYGTGAVPSRSFEFLAPGTSVGPWNACLASIPIVPASSHSDQALVRSSRLSPSVGFHCRMPMIRENGPFVAEKGRRMKEKTILTLSTFLCWCVGVGVIVAGSTGTSDGGLLRTEKRGGRGEGTMPTTSNPRWRRKIGGEWSGGVSVTGCGGEEESRSLGAKGKERGFAAIRSRTADNLGISWRVQSRGMRLGRNYCMHQVNRANPEAYARWVARN